MKILIVVKLEFNSAEDDDEDYYYGMDSPEEESGMRRGRNN
jgi:hypothetical protein